MILEGSTISSTGHARQMAAHLYKDENEEIHVRGIYGNDHRKAVENTLVDMYQLTKLTKGKKNAIFHVAISPRENEALTNEQKQKAINMIQKRFGLEDQMFFEMDHVKEGRAHTHVFWSTVDIEQGKLKNLSHYKLRLQTLANEMEVNFGHERTARQKSDQSYEVTNSDRMRQNRTKEKALERKKEITALWEQSDSAKAFIAALEEKGYALAKGDRSKFALIDRHGNISNLVRDLPKVIKTKEVMARFGEEYKLLSSVEKAKEQINLRNKRKSKELSKRGQKQETVQNHFNHIVKNTISKTRGNYPKEKKAYDNLRLEEAIKRGLEHFLERKSSIGMYQLSHYIHSNSNFTRTKIEEALKKQKNVITAMRGDKLYVTTHKAVQEEIKLITTANKGKNTQIALHKNYTPKQQFLNEGQKNAIQHILNSKDRITIVSGSAGVGKTSLMREVKEAIEESGKTLYAFAPSANASRGVLRQKGFEGANTIATFLGSKKVQEQTKNGVILIDEAGMVGNKTMNRVFEVAKEQNARIILSGDHRQHNSPEAGDALRILEEKSNLRVGRVTKIVRQKDETYKKAVEYLAKGESYNGFKTLQKMGVIKEVYDDKTRYNQLAEDYITARKAGRSILVVSPTHAEGKEASAAIRKKLKDQGLIGKEDFTFKTHRNLSLTIEQKRQFKSYGKNMSVQFHEKVPGFEIGVSYEVSGYTKNEKVIVEDPEGNKKVIPLFEAEKFQLFQIEKTVLAEGDRLKITGNGQTLEKHPLNNGEIYTIKGFDENGNIVLENGQTISKDYKNMALGYYETSHASQGKDAQEVFVIQGSKSFMASCSKQFYVSVSRGSEKVTIYTDDANGLYQAIDKSGDRMMAMEIAQKSPKFIFNLQFDKQVIEKEKPNDLDKELDLSAKNQHSNIPETRSSRKFDKKSQLSKTKDEFRERVKFYKAGMKAKPKEKRPLSKDRGFDIS